MPVEWSGLAPELLLALDRRTRRLLTCSVRGTHRCCAAVSPCPGR